MTIEEKIITKKRFSTAVEKLVYRNRISYLDAIIEVAEEKELDVSNVSNLLTTSLKEKLEVEATSLNLIAGKKTNKLPL